MICPRLCGRLISWLYQNQYGSFFSISSFQNWPWINFFMLCVDEKKRQKLTVRAKESTCREVPILVIRKWGESFPLQWMPLITQNCCLQGSKLLTWDSHVETSLFLTNMFCFLGKLLRPSTLALRTGTIVFQFGDQYGWGVSKPSGGVWRWTLKWESVTKTWNPAPLPPELLSREG